MSYGLKYIVNYDGGPRGVEPYVLEFYFKDWTGSFTNVTGSKVVTNHRWEKDEPKPGVKGSVLEMEILNINQTLPLAAFYSSTDDNCKVVFKWRDQVQFTGFLLQDDCNEIMVDWTHPFKLSATDNLGLLKDVSLLDASRLYGPYLEYDTEIVYYTQYVFNVYDGTIPFAVGDTMVITGSPTGFDGSYLITDVQRPGVTTFLTVSTPIPAFGGGVSHLRVITPIDLTAPLTLAQIVRLCLLSTNLELNTDVYASIIEAVTATPRFLEETYLPGTTFLKGSTWNDCYTVLTQIFERFNATCFQAEGVWNILRWEELRRYSNAIPCYHYDKDMVNRQGHAAGHERLLAFRFHSIVNTIEFTSSVLFPQVGQLLLLEDSPPLNGTYHIITVDNSVPGSPVITVSETLPEATGGGGTFTLFSLVSNVFDDIFTTGLDQITYPIVGLTGSILRPFQYTQETFNYKQPAQLLQNADLQTLGSFVREYTDGTDTIKEYLLSLWFPDDLFPSPTPEHIIRIRYDNLGNEIERLAVIDGATLDAPRAIQSTAIEVNTDDVVKFSFSFRTDVSQPGNVNITFAVRLFNGTLNRYVQNDGSWLSTIGFSYNVPSGDNTNQWHNVEIPSLPAPFPGLLYCYLAEATANPANETWYKDLAFEITNNVNKSTKIIGQQHTDRQTPVIKNNDAVEIFIDDSPRNSINGSMRLSTYHNLIQDLTLFWGYAPDGTSRLGQLTTFETLFARRIPRTKLEGTMYGLIQNANHKSFMAISATVGEIDVPSGLYKMVFPGLPIGFLSVGQTFQLSGPGSTPDYGTYTVAAFLSPDTITVVETVPDEEGGDFTVSVGMPRHFSMLTLCKYVGWPGKYFLQGTMTIDHKANKITGTFWEQWIDGEIDSDLRDGYNFIYLYDTSK